MGEIKGQEKGTLHTKNCVKRYTFLISCIFFSPPASEYPQNNSKSPCLSAYPGGCAAKARTFSDSGRFPAMRIKTGTIKNAGFLSPGHPTCRKKESPLSGLPGPQASKESILQVSLCSTDFHSHFHYRMISDYINNAIPELFSSPFLCPADRLDTAYSRKGKFPEKMK